MLGVSIADGRFEFGPKIGAGSFGSVYCGYDAKAKKDVAIKLEFSNCRAPQLEYEARLYNALGSCRGLPTLFWYGQEEDCNVIVLDLLGPSLHTLMQSSRPPYSLKTVLQVGLQALNVLEYVHGTGFIHRDVKPANFVMGRGKDSSVVHLIDFGLAKRYWSHKADSHNPCRVRTSSGIIGSSWYCSINAHRGVDLSRRDDIESLAYMLIHMIRGDLPWQRLDPMPKDKAERNERIRILKVETTAEDLCQGISVFFSSLLMMTSSLEFQEKPYYGMLRKWIATAAAHGGVVLDDEFDWTQHHKDNELVVPAEDEDWQTCNCSRISVGSSKGSGSLSWRARRSSEGVAHSLSTTGSGRGPLAPLALEKNTKIEDKSGAADLACAMQRARATDDSC